MAKFTYITLILLLPTMLWSQRIRISGMVINEQTGEPLEYYTIRGVGTISGTMGNDKGEFSFDVDRLPDSLEVSYEGHKQSYSMEGYQAQPGQILKMNLQYREEDRCPCAIEVLIHERTFVPGMDRLYATGLQRNDNSSVEQGMNLIPGVKFESRGAGGSRRLVVRGGFLRSPFGVRDVKVYFGGAPLTSPDGSTPLELIDAQAINTVEVKKGQFSSEYGAVSNGVVLFEPGDGQLLGKYGGHISQTLGSFGYTRTAISQAYKTDKSRASIQYVHQSQTGYRDLEANAKDFLQANAVHLKRQHIFRFNGLLYKGNWGLPGALDSNQVAADPRRALPYSKAANAHVEREHLRLGFGHGYGKNRFFIASNLYLHLSNKENPYGTSPFFQGYKFEKSIGMGGRTELSFPKFLLGLFRTGLEYQTERLDFKEFENNEGRPGPARTISIIHSTQMLGYLGLRQNMGKHSFYENLSLNQVIYRQTLTRSVDIAPNGQTGFKPTLAFSGQYAYNPNETDKPSIFLRIASGFSPPALWEMTDSNGAFNHALRPETGLNLELRAMDTGRFLHKSYKSALSIYHHLLSNAIVPQTLSSGRTIYANQGNVRQVGVEGQISYTPFFVTHGPIRYVTLTLNAAWQNYRFLDYRLGQQDLRGKYVPGAPLWTANFQLDIHSPWKTQLQLTANAIGKNYLDNANLHSQPTYLLLNAKATQTLNLRKQGGEPSLQLEPSIGINNILDTQYTNFPQLNATNGKFWNPAPGTNFFGGIDFRF